ncbi:MAG TPA: glycosyl hydrolase [Opitutaceae bacterium]|nr:glycosyl hydrolase [Opitutaceae bacterium]
MNPALPRRSALILFAFAAAHLAAQDRPWQKLSDPTVDEVAPHFAQPPSEYSSQIAWGWNGKITREVIARDLDHIKSLNLWSAWVEPGRNPAAPYLSPAYFENVRIAVEEAKKRGMHLWFDDDGGYPSGFAGGMFTEKRPDLDMEALVEAEQVPLAPGQTLSRPLGGKSICALAVNLGTGEASVIEAKDGQVSWTAPATGRWAVSFPQWAFRSGVTRSANNKSGAKDGEHSLGDYLNPEADRLFINWTLASYEKAVGDEFGKTLLGFRGDEAAYNFNPWTPDFPAQFLRRKGYDIRPYLPAVAAIQIGRMGRGRMGGPPPAPAAANLDAAHRAYADYCDVWSDLFGENFFSACARWCAEHDLELQTHIEHEENLPMLASADGDFFKCMRDLAVPGIDVIWHQMWNDVVTDFPKLASSSTHLNGHPQAMSESFAAMNGAYPTPDLSEAGWIVNHQIALGINHFEFMSMRASTNGTVGAGAPPRPQESLLPRMPTPARGAAPAGYRYLSDPKFPELAAYVNRTTYVLDQGRPGAEIGVYIPSSSFWFGDTASNRTFLRLVHSLLEHQRDLDFVDDYALSTSLQLRGAELVNRSGQGYRAIVIPPAAAISEAALGRLKAFAAAGGRVIFAGGVPQLAMGRNFLTARAPGDLGWATVTSAAEATPELLQALPDPEVALDAAAPGLKYIHRRLRDGEAYFFFNEGDGPVAATARVRAAGSGQRAELWDAHTGRIAALQGASFSEGKAELPLRLDSWATALIVIRAGSGALAAAP